MNYMYGKEIAEELLPKEWTVRHSHADPDKMCAIVADALCAAGLVFGGDSYKERYAAKFICAMHDRMAYVGIVTTPGAKFYDEAYRQRAR
jgi:hypothetical protein